MARHSRLNWNLRQNRDNTVPNIDVTHALLMDLRDVMDEISSKLSVLRCSEFTGIPRTLRVIARNTRSAKPGRKSRRIISSRVRR